MRKKQSIQKKNRNTVFSYDQYWNMNYTILYKNNIEEDFKSFIKAKSYDSAKKILTRRLKEEDDVKKVKAIVGFMFHSNYISSNNGKLTIKNWEQIRSASFPNENNVLYRKKFERSEEKSNRFNSTNWDHLKNIGFQKGEDNWSHKNRKGVYLPIEERKGMIYKGKWIKWDKEEMEKTTRKIINAFEINGNNRLKSAKFLGISRGALYSLMRRIDIDWKKEYPAPKQVPPRVPKSERSVTQKKVMKRMMDNGHVPFSTLTESQKKKRERNLRKAKKKKTIERLNYWKPRLIESLIACSNSRTKASKYLNIKIDHFRKLLRETKHEINWSKLFPTKHFKPK